MFRAPLRFAFRRLGRRYPRIAMVVQFQFAHAIVMGGVGLLLLYVPMSGGEFGRIVAVSQGLLLLENVLAVRAAWALVRPADPWLRGDRSPSAAVAAFRALAGLPVAFLRSRRWWLVWSLLPVSAYITWEIDEGWWPTLPIIVAGAAVVLLYGALLRLLALELMLRPVLERLSRDLPDDAPLGRATLPLQRRLLLVLPAINIITGVVVSGLASPGQDGLLALGFGVVLAVGVAFTLSFELSLLLARSIVEPLSDLRAGADAVARGDLDVHVPVLGTDEAGALAMSFNRMVAGLRERERLHGALAAFVDPQLTDRVLAEGHELPGEEVEVSVLFLDIRGFTQFAERASAAEVVARLNDFYGVVVPELLAHGGHVNAFMGDGLLAVFGAPTPLPDHADRAVAAALRVAELVRDRYGEELRIGVGVNSGPVVAGTIGGGGRVDFTVIGDPVNTAARVEEATRTTGDDVLLTAGTRALLTRDHGPFVAREEIALKGKRDPVTLYAPSEDLTAERERSMGRHGVADPARVARP
ncbi:HAMP domain-containing protein [Conexibacter sp. W3-3-2]|uniref:adenylate/guanylate cyclase domain-containing protein n=1 Tax=Conexibacter sp. W3-3-2 TaxID=2675227 RepID=UPI0012B8564F|nr:adenylate/guanylate cyclase domain-containing protein [Conexibacter sp. W3-3-2]MTD46601.1 HAMP domain-containing protein [Conexibacter sp. W3-3-2]